MELHKAEIARDPLFVNECLPEDDLRRYVTKFQAGDLATYSLYTDAHAGRVVEIKRNGKEVVFQEDCATLSANWKPEVSPGGFVGHCTNNDDQQWEYRPNSEGVLIVFTLRRWRGVRMWTVKGDTPDGRNRLSLGQHHFHDYNF